jgi:hypothetical protein
MANSKQIVQGIIEIALQDLQEDLAEAWRAGDVEWDDIYKELDAVGLWMHFEDYFYELKAEYEDDE